MPRSRSRSATASSKALPLTKTSAMVRTSLGVLGGLRRLLKGLLLGLLVHPRPGPELRRVGLRLRLLGGRRPDVDLDELRQPVRRDPGPAVLVLPVEDADLDGDGLAAPGAQGVDLEHDDRRAHLQEEDLVPVDQRLLPDPVAG